MDNFEYDAFLQELYTDVDAAIYSEEEGATSEEKFTEIAVDYLTSAGESDGVRIVDYLREDKQERVVKKINGYSFDDDYETVDLFITHYVHTNLPYRFSEGKEGIKRLINRCVKFLNDSLNAGAEDIEPSNPAYECAKVLMHNRNEFIRANIFIISNALMPYDVPENIKIKGFEDLQINVHVWDGERIHRLVQSNSEREPIEVDFKEHFGAMIPCLEMPSKNNIYECYLAIIPGEILADLYKIYGTRLLESNVRAFLQQTGKVNKGIRDTIKDEPYMFLPFNNGLATTALDVTFDTDELGRKVIRKIKDFQIVNGGQTTASLFHTRKKWKNTDLSQVFVQMKLTVIHDEEIKNKKVPFISKYANSQNKVSEVDLSSNHPFLQKVEELSRITYAVNPHNKNQQSLWFFERVTGQYKEALNKEGTKGKQNAFIIKNPKNQIITKSDLAKYMNVWNQQPHVVSRGAQKNYASYMSDTNKAYKNTLPKRVYFEDLVANAILFNCTDDLFGNKRKGNHIGDTNIKAFTVAYSLSLFHYLTRNNLNLGVIWEQQAVPNEIQNVLKSLLFYTYSFLTKESDALVSEFSKRITTWEKLVSCKPKVDLSLISPFIHTDQSKKDRYEKNEEEFEMLRIQNMNKVKGLGAKFWDGVEIWGKLNKFLSGRELNHSYTIHYKIKKTLPLSDGEISAGLRIIEKLELEGLQFEEIMKLSNLEETGGAFDLEGVYTRLLKISEKDWKTIISILERTGKVEPKVLGITKMVSENALKKKHISERQLVHMPKVLEVANKFGINV